MLPQEGQNEARLDQNNAANKWSSEHDPAA